MSLFLTLTVKRKNLQLLGQVTQARVGATRRNHGDEYRNKNLDGATLYVTLEPCCHIGKSKPCTQSIIKNNLKRVVIAMVDPNPLVAGKGIQELKKMVLR